MFQMNTCSCTAPAVEIPVLGLKLSLDEQALKSIQSPPVTGAGVPVGTMLLLPFRKDELPVGWHFCDGTAVALDSAAGVALNALPLGYKADWGIAVENDTITQLRCSTMFYGVFEFDDPSHKAEGTGKKTTKKPA